MEIQFCKIATRIDVTFDKDEWMIIDHSKLHKEVF